MELIAPIIYKQWAQHPAWPFVIGAAAAVVFGWIGLRGRVMGGRTRADHQALDFLLQGGRGGNRRAERACELAPRIELVLAHCEQIVVAAPERHQVLDRGRDKEGGDVELAQDRDAAANGA